MKWIITILALTAIFFGIPSFGTQPSLAIPTETTQAPHFPTLKASSLAEHEFDLPSGFEGERNLVLIAFERKQQSDLDTWLKEMKRFEELDPQFHYYEMPTIERPNAFMRWFIDTGMRRGISDHKARASTITLYVEKKPFCDALAITNQNQVHAFLVNREGKVLWKSEGRFDESKAASLRNALGAQ